MRKVTLSISLLFSIAIYVGCIAPDNADTPTNSSGNNSLSVVAMNDTTANPGDSFFIHATGSGGESEVAQYLWALDGENFNDVTTDGSLKVSFPPTFARILVKVVNETNDTSLADTIGIAVIYSVPDSLSAEGFVQLGNKEKRDQEFQKALDYYNLATEFDPTLADGWYLKAEMELRVEGITLPFLINELQNENPSKLPFFPDTNTNTDSILYIVVQGSDTFPVTPLDTLYDKLALISGPIFKAYFAMKNIFDEIAYRGLFTRDVILLDFTMLSTLFVVMQAVDQNPRDSTLTQGYGPSNLEREIFKVLAINEDAPGLLNLDTAQLALINGSEYNINRLIDDLITAAQVSLSAANDLDAEIKSSTASGIDTTMMEAPIKLMKTIIAEAEAVLNN